MGRNDKSNLCPLCRLGGKRLKQTVTVRVPATTANLGPGFDTFGLALCLYNTLHVQTEAASLELNITGEGADSLPRDRQNIVVAAMERLCAEVGASLPGLLVTMENRIPLARGLGSSAAARVAALVAANTLLESPLSKQRLLELATEMEGHPDNAAAALFGELAVCTVGENGAVHHLRVPVPNPPLFVLLVPDEEVATAEARRVLPSEVPRADAVFNVSRACLLLAGLSIGDRSALNEALRDKLHQPYRSRLMPWFDEVAAAALEAGALGAVLSGAGSSLLALAESHTEEVGRAMLQALRRFGHNGRVLLLEMDHDGAVVLVGGEQESRK